MSLKDFEIGKELGKGAFGSVAIVKRTADGKTYAMKRVKISQLGTKERENALNEVRILASLFHPNIIGYKEAFFDEDSKTLNIVMEIADDGDLESKIQKNIKSRGTFLEKDLWSYMIQILNGLKYLHDNKIMHRDLKCANIFMMKNGTIKLGDLNVSKIVKMGLAHTQTGTPYYASPEVWADKPYDYKSDIWSVGCVMYELCALKPPFRATSLEQLFKNVTRGVYESIPSSYSKDLANVIGLMLQVNPHNRHSCDQLLNHDTILKKMLFIREGKEIVPDQQPIQLINTIKLPRNMNEINQRLPKKKMYKEMEEMNLMNNDVNVSKKPANPILEINNKKENEREREMKELKEYKQKEIVSENKERIHHQMNRVPSNNNMIKNRIGENNGNNRVIESNPIKKENIAIYRPSSAKSDPKQQQQQPKTPIIMKENPIQLNNINNIIYNSNNRQVKGNNEIIINKQVVNRNQVHIYNSNNNPSDKNKPNSQRPQSAKVGSGGNNIVNSHVNNIDYNNKINQINQQIARKNIVSERPKSPPRVNLANNYNKIIRKPSGGNSPRDKSPIKDNRMNYINNQILRPASGKDRVSSNNGSNPVILKNEKKVVYEKINYDKGILNPSKLIDKKPNYHYNAGGNVLLHNKPNIMNPVKVNDNNHHLINRGGVGSNGPKIVYIGNKK